MEGLPMLVPDDTCMGKDWSQSGVASQYKLWLWRNRELGGAQVRQQYKGYLTKTASLKKIGAISEYTPPPCVVYPSY